MPSLLDRVERRAAEASRSTEPAPASSAPPVVRAEKVAVQNPSPPPNDEDAEAKWQQLRHWLVEKIIAGLPSAGELTRTPQSTRLVAERIASTLQSNGIRVPPISLTRLEAEVTSEILGFGPLDPLLADPAVTEIMANGPHHIFVEKQGQLQKTEIRFNDEAHMLRIVDRLIRPLGRRVDGRSPVVDVRLADGSRLNIVVPPSALDGPALTICKSTNKKLTADELVQLGVLTSELVELLRACVIARLNIVVAGGASSGRTTMLNVLAGFIPSAERIVTLEESAELQLSQKHVVRLEAKPPEADGSGRLTLGDLVVNALRMHPDRLVVGECRGAEIRDLLQAMVTGHDGSLTTLYANTSRDAISRIETIARMAAPEMPIHTLREQIAGAIDLIVVMARLRDGSRRIVEIAEVQGIEGEFVVQQDLFRFVERGVDDDGRVLGALYPTGVRPKFMPRLEGLRLDLPPELFQAF